jgi:hypothetical protein
LIEVADVEAMPRECLRGKLAVVGILEQLMYRFAGKDRLAVGIPEDSSVDWVVDNTLVVSGLEMGCPVEQLWVCRTAENFDCHTGLPTARDMVHFGNASRSLEWLAVLAVLLSSFHCKSCKKVVVELPMIVGDNQRSWSSVD